MSALDTSVVVPALTRWHEAHEPARRAARDALVPAHVFVESYAVLTRLPPPHRLDGAVAAALLDGWFPSERIVIPTPRLLRGVVRRLAGAGVTGGATYDGLVALTASERGLLLLTRDTRAAAVYGALEVDYDLVRP